jgi:uncharacterized protein YhbP (UPF0306 family)
MISSAKRQVGDALETVAAFVRQHHVMTLATAQDGIPYAAPLFYAYDEQNNRFVFASGNETEHTVQMQKNPEVAAAVYLETKTVGKIQGVQIRGRVVSADAEDTKSYYGRFPYARALQPTLWRLEPHWMKLTDNRLGFGTKLIWQQ